MNKTKHQIARLEQILDNNHLECVLEWQALKQELKASRVLPWVIVGAGLGVGFLAGKTRGLTHFCKTVIKMPMHYANWHEKISSWLPEKN